MKKTSYLLIILVLGSFLYPTTSQAYAQHLLIFSHVTWEPHPHIKNVKDEFEKKRIEIGKMYRKWKISKKEARELLMKYKQQMIFETRDKIRQEHKKKMDKKRGKLKKQIKTVLQPKLDEIEKLPKTKQIKVYKRLITRIEEVQTKANKRQRILYELMNELMKEKLKNINTEQKK